jgi:hypothetical protein
MNSNVHAERNARIVGELWAKGRNPAPPAVFMVLDGARDPRIEPLVRDSGCESCCLYSGVLSARLRAAAPYLVRLEPAAAFTQRLLDLAWGEEWGCFARVEADLSLEALRKHLRTLLRVKDEFGKTLIFRYYDPRVLRAYLPTCLPAEVDAFLGPVRRICMESDSGRELLSFARGLVGAEIGAAPVGPPAAAPRAFLAAAAAGAWA